MLNPAIFKSPGQAAKTLAHEMGHLADYLPDYTMARGNLIGRVATLNKFLRKTFSDHLTEERVDELLRQRNDLREQRRELRDEEGNVSDRAADSRILTELKKTNKEIKTLRKSVTITDKKIRKELERLTRIWKPFMKKVVTVDAEGKKVVTTKAMGKAEVAKSVDPDFLAYRPRRSKIKRSYPHRSRRWFPTRWLVWWSPILEWDFLRTGTD